MAGIGVGCGEGRVGAGRRPGEPEKAIEVWVEAKDNCEPAANVGRSPVRRLKLRQPELDAVKKQELDAERNRALLRSLDLALVPSKAKPGSVEAMIDGLVDWTGYGQPFERSKPANQYWRISGPTFSSMKRARPSTG